MSQTIVLSSEFEVVTCANCGMTFAIPKTFYKERLDDHRGFNCPKGHSNYFPQMSDAEKLREQLDRCQVNRDHWKDGHDAVKRSRDSLKGVITKMKKKGGKTSETKIA